MTINTTIRGTYCDMPIEIDADITIIDEVIVVDSVNSVKLMQPKPSGQIQFVEFHPEDGTPDQAECWFQEAENYLKIDRNLQDKLREEFREARAYKKAMGRAGDRVGCD